jgi:hypothetical protein
MRATHVQTHTLITSSVLFSLCTFARRTIPVLATAATQTIRTSLRLFFFLSYNVSSF